MLTLKPYLANRVGYIQQHTNIQNWKHVRTALNPADCASRGITANALVNHNLWWHGPVALMRDNPPSVVPDFTEAEIDAIATETKASKANVGRTLTSFNIKTQYRQGKEIIVIDLIERFSKIGQLLRTTAYVLRGNPKRRQYWRQPTVQQSELTEAMQWHLRSAQSRFFSEEIHRLSRRYNESNIAASSALVSLAPYIDDSGLLRVGGRIRHSELSEQRRHPIILAKTCTIAQLLVREIHHNTAHGQVDLMLQILREKYWVISARALVKQCIYRCVICRRHSQQMAQQQMASLPPARVTAAPPFSLSGVDYCGPFSIRIGSQRTRTTKKTYAAIFVCMATKAVHIELAEDLSAEAFLNTFTRFVSRRGLCHHLYSDNGTQFTKANKLLQDDLAQWRGIYTQQELASTKTEWLFISAGAPHQGGLWEAAVKSAKRHLLRVVGNQSIYYDQLNTLLTRIEACLNSRPLIALHDGVGDRLALTPADFLVGRSLVSIPEPPVAELPANRMKYWQHLRQMHQSFWKRWHEKYLATLQQRNKWKQISENLAINDIVVIRSENLPPTKWRLGRIAELHPGTDGLVRNVTVNYYWMDGDKGLLKQCTRPVQKICKLLSENSEPTGPAGQDVQDPVVTTAP